MSCQSRSILVEVRRKRQVEIPEQRISCRIGLELLEMASKNKGLRGNEDQAKTRLLLTLWDLGGAQQKVKRSDLNTKVQRKDENATHYQGIYDRLREEGAIAMSMEKRVTYVALTEQGMQQLVEGLKNPDFGFDGAQVGSRLANSLLKWIRFGMDSGAGAAAVPAAAAAPKVEKVEAIDGYEEFAKVALQVYDRLNRDYNLKDLVPIYRMRREMGAKVTHSQFNEWLLEMQANDIFQLMAGEMADITPDKREDSINVPGGGLRYYAKRLNSED